MQGGDREDGGVQPYDLMQLWDAYLLGLYGDF